MYVSPGSGWCCLGRDRWPCLRLVMGIDSASRLLMTARGFVRVLVVVDGSIHTFNPNEMPPSTT